MLRKILKKRGMPEDAIHVFEHLVEKGEGGVFTNEDFETLLGSRLAWPYISAKHKGSPMRLDVRLTPEQEQKAKDALWNDTAGNLIKLGVVRRVSPRSTSLKLAIDHLLAQELLDASKPAPKKR
ncbi:Uncharacterised protein [Candidatus Norongarragalina meridionalis]|nr:Uncharacterised protein [Candidatus Norongarragalina meridionalis]